jgi:hypothetical protein
VKTGEFARGGGSRGREPVRVADHDIHPDAELTAAGIRHRPTQLHGSGLPAPLGMQGTGTAETLGMPFGRGR